mmetsp:Transcript_479/g.1125  ORF Transcript_479/g.1125 Transcript_479/m.1125 type:complete len:260 (-) Transcript_479:553-1332(-)
MAFNRGYTRLLPSTAGPGPSSQALSAGFQRSIVEDEDDIPQRQAPTRGVPVTLHVYSVTRLPVLLRANGFLSAMGTGAYHAAVEIYGREWSFGATEDGSSGVFCCRPGQCDDHTYLRAIPMGNADVTEAEVLGLIGRLRKEWCGDDYDLLRCNCCHFSAELLRQLGCGPCPSWLNNLASAGASVNDQAHQAKSLARLAADKIGSNQGSAHARDAWKAATAAVVAKARIQASHHGGAQSFDSPNALDYRHSSRTSATNSC